MNLVVIELNRTDFFFLYKKNPFPLFILDGFPSFLLIFYFKLFFCSKKNPFLQKSIYCASLQLIRHTRRLIQPYQQAPAQAHTHTHTQKHKTTFHHGFHCLRFGIRERGYSNQEPPHSKPVRGVHGSADSNHPRKIPRNLCIMVFQIHLHMDQSSTQSKYKNFCLTFVLL